MTTRITIRGDKELYRRLNNLKHGRKRRLAMKAMGLHLVGEMKVYPPKPAGSTYERTRNLAKRWDVRAKQNEALVQNFAEYAPYVQDDERQAWFHKVTGWQTIRKTLSKNEKKIVEALKRTIDRILEGR